jgi:hypothetical protein
LRGGALETTPVGTPPLVTPSVVAMSARNADGETDPPSSPGLLGFITFWLDGQYTHASVEANRSLAS